MDLSLSRGVSTDILSAVLGRADEDSVPVLGRELLGAEELQKEKSVLEYPYAQSSLFLVLRTQSSPATLKTASASIFY